MLEYADQQIRSRNSSDAFTGLLGSPTPMPVSDWFRSTMSEADCTVALCHHHSFAILLDLPDLPGCEMAMGILTRDDQQPIHHSWIELPLNNKTVVVSASLVHTDNIISIYTADTFYKNKTVTVNRIASMSHADARRYLPDQKTINLLQINKIVLRLLNKTFGLNLVSQTTKEDRIIQARCKVKLREGIKNHE